MSKYFFLFLTYISIVTVNGMNYIEISIIFSKMIDNTRLIMLDLEVSHLKRGISIDKNSH